MRAEHKVVIESGHWACCSATHSSFKRAVATLHGPQKEEDYHPGGFAAEVFPQVLSALM